VIGRAEIGALLSLAVALISLGVGLIGDGEYLAGCASLAVGALLAHVVAYLAERRLAEAVERRLKELAPRSSHGQQAGRKIPYDLFCLECPEKFEFTGLDSGEHLVFRCARCGRLVGVRRVEG